MYIIVYIIWNCICWLYKIVYIYEKLCLLNVQFLKKNVYIKCSEFSMFFENLCMWMYRNIYIFWKIVDVECTKLVTFFEKCVYQMYRIVHILIYVEYIELCTLNVHNCVHSLKICICWMYNIEYIIWKIVYVKYTELWTF